MSKTVRLLNVGEIQNSSGYVKQMIHPNHAEGVAPAASKAFFMGKYSRISSSISSGSWSWFNGHGVGNDSQNGMNPVADKDGNIWVVGGGSYQVRKINGSTNELQFTNTVYQYANVNTWPATSSLGSGAPLVERAYVDICSNGEKGVFFGGLNMFPPPTYMWNNQTGSYLWSFSSNSHSLGPIFSQTGGVGWARAMHSNGDHCFRMHRGWNSGSVVNHGAAMDKASFTNANSSSWGMLPATNGLGQAAGNELDIYHQVGGEDMHKSSLTQNASTVKIVGWPNAIAKWNGKTSWGSIVSDGDQLVCKTLTQSGSNGYFQRFNVSMTDGSLITGWNENGPWGANSSILEKTCACAYNS